MAFTFDAVFAVDPNNPANIAKNASITIFDPADPAQAPVAITDPTGVPLPNPMTLDAAGMGPAYQHPTLARVGWKGAGFVGYFTSYEGMLNETKAAKDAALAAASEAGAAAQADLEARIASGVFKGEKGTDGANVLPTDTAIKNAITTPGTETATALSATYGPDAAGFQNKYAYKSDALPVPAKASMLPPKPQKQILHSFQAGHGWSSVNGTVTMNDTSIFAMGSQSVKIVTNGAGQTAALYKWNNAAVDFTNKNLALLVRITNSDNLANFSVQVGTGGNMTNGGYIGVLNTAAPDRFLGQNEWYWITLPWNPATTGTLPDRTAITSFSIEVKDNNAGVPVTVQVQAIAAVPIPAAWTNGCVSFDLDDGFASHYTIARPILSRYGFAANSYPVSEAIDAAGGMTTAQLQELQNIHGWTIGAHSDTWAHHNMPLAQQTGPELENFVRANRKWLTDRGLAGFDFFAYPGGADDGANLTTARKYYVTARTVSQRTRETLPANDPHRLRVLLWTASNTVASITAEVDKAYTGNYHLILVAHDIVASGATGGTILTATFQSVVDYVATKGIPVKSMQQVLATR